MKPIIITVDYELEVLNAIVRDLNKKYHKNYRVIKTESGESALNLASEMMGSGFTRIHGFT